jgi:hypothetical protein
MSTTAGLIPKKTEEDINYKDRPDANISPRRERDGRQNR